MMSITYKRIAKTATTTACRAAVPRAFATDASKPNDPADRMARMNSFEPEIHGLGNSIIHGYYDHLGDALPVPPFLKVPKTVHIVGAPLTWGQPRTGTDQGPQMLRDCGLDGTLINLEWRVNDKGDLSFQGPTRGDPEIDPTKCKGKAKNCYSVGKSLGKIQNAVYAGAQSDEFVLTLGGDHSLGTGTVAGILKHRPDVGIIWVDAHADLNTPETSPSGNMHGMPLGLLMGLTDTNNLPGFEWMADIPKLKPEQLVFVGLRDIDNGERHFIRSLGIKTFTMQDVDRYGIGKVMEETVKHLRLPNGEPRPLHLSFDIDAVDPEFAKATGTIVRGG
mmetsp:Transcript_28710/g.46431  ORF Transcript_28710/g.46431 Transcript_28710/m.46431 type:complete len:334 (+) Transcript_28710:256-1257(+)